MMSVGNHEKKGDKMKRLLVIMMLLLVAAPASAALSAQQKKSKIPVKMASSSSSVELRMSMRKLWEEHITYTRNYIISSVANLEDVNAVTARLLRNQDDIGNAIKPFYGVEAGNKLAALLKAHITIAAEVVNAAKMDNKAELTKANQKWYANADEIAVLLSGANPNWRKDDLKLMLYKHLEFTTEEVVARIKKDWAANIDAYDKGHTHILMFADVLASGIVTQYPDKFMK
jgi:hypothetical protein